MNLATDDRTSAAGRKTVLLIDDAASHRKLYGLWLSMGGYGVEVLDDERVAQDTAERVRPHAILVDIRLPFVNGLNVIRALKTAAKTRHIPVFAFTVMDGKEHRSACLAAGADGFMCKPSSMEPFLAEVDKLFLAA